MYFIHFPFFSPKFFLDALLSKISVISLCWRYRYCLVKWHLDVISCVKIVNQYSFPQQNVKLPSFSLIIVFFTWRVCPLIHIFHSSLSSALSMLMFRYIHWVNLYIWHRVLMRSNKTVINHLGVRVFLGHWYQNLFIYLFLRKVTLTDGQ